MQIYEVIFQDEYNNLYQLGYYKKLQYAITDINEYLSQYKDENRQAIKLNDDDLIEYFSTFNSCFDKEIPIEEGVVYVRGFILNSDDLIEEINKITK